MKGRFLGCGTCGTPSGTVLGSRDSRSPCVIQFQLSFRSLPSSLQVSIRCCPGSFPRVWAPCSVLPPQRPVCRVDGGVHSQGLSHGGPREDLPRGQQGTRRGSASRAAGQPLLDLGRHPTGTEGHFPACALPLAVLPTSLGGAQDNNLEMLLKI